MDLIYAPRKQVAARMEQGWRLITGVEYRLNEYAVLMADQSGQVAPMFCCVAGCDHTHEALGLCAMHYKRLRRTGLPFVESLPGPKPGYGKKEPRPCSEPGCADHAHGLGLCRRHYLRHYRARKLLEAA